MIKNYLEIGQIVSTHGIRGEVRVNPWCNGPEFIKKFKTLYKDENGTVAFRVISCRPHGNVAITKLEGVDTVEAAQALRNTVLFIKREDAHLPEGEWFISELLGCKVIDVDDKEKCYGEITDVAQTGANDVWYVKTPDGEEVLIPAIPDVVVKCDVGEEKVYIHALRGLFSED
ncbi:MAG: 16S rRNA processing protein RimM [Clostridia bacterium]|nr:16S rRNA processing protein RimM [Clostridia bacterium]